MFAVFEDAAPVVEGISIDEAFLDVHGLERDRRHARSRSPSGCVETCASRSGCPSRSASRGRSSWPRSRARSPSRTGCSSCRPTASSTFLHPLPVERLWGVGPVDLDETSRPRHHHRRQVALLAEAGLVAMLGQAAGRHIHALAHNLDPRPVQHAAGDGRSAPSARAAAALDARAVDADLVALVDRVTRRMRAARPGRPDGRPPAPLRRLHARDPVAHAAAARPRGRWRSSRPHAAPRGLAAR